MAPGQLPPPANSGEGRGRGERNVFEKTSSGSERGGGGDADAAAGGLEGAAPQEHVGEGTGTRNSPGSAIRSDGNSIRKKIALQRTKELHSSPGKNVFQGMAWHRS